MSGWYDGIHELNVHHITQFLGFLALTVETAGFQLGFLDAHTLQDPEINWKMYYLKDKSARISNCSDLLMSL